jgi:hypothetical protein
MVDDKDKNVPRKRKVNPALLLGGSGFERPASQPALVNAENFPKQGAPRKEFMVPKKSAPLPNPFNKADDGVAEGNALEGDAPEESKTGSNASKGSVKKVVVADGSMNPFVKKGVLPVIEDVEESDNGSASDVNDVIVASGNVSVSAVSDVEDVTSELAEKDEKVSPSGDSEVVEPVVPKRVINPMFLAGEERDSGSSKKSAPERLVRPSLILRGDRGAAFPSRPAKPERKPFQALPEDEVKPRGQYSRKIESNIEFEEWSDDTSTDTSIGLGGENDVDWVEPQYSKAFHLTTRDIIMMRFLARYRYAYTDQLARLVDSMPRTVSARLRVLEKRGFVHRQAVTERQYLWTTRKAGNLIVDINFPEIRKGSLSYATIAHTIGLANLGVELEREAGGKDLLGEGKNLSSWVMPENRWKLGIWGNPEGKVTGEMTVTEREIRQGQLRWRGGRSSKEMRDLVSLAAGTGEASELEEGQEGLFVIYGAGGKGGEHIPDLVVARDRDEDGKPQHLAIELELTPKSTADWRKILRNYRDNGEMYSKIYYFTHKRSISTALHKVNEEVGLGDRLVVRKYVPMNSSMPFWG